MPAVRVRGVVCIGAISSRVLSVRSTETESTESTLYREKRFQDFNLFIQICDILTHVADCSFGVRAGGGCCFLVRPYGAACVSSSARIEGKGVSVMKLTEYLPTLSLYRAVPVTVQFQYNPIYTYKISYKTEFLFSSHFSTPRSKKKKKKSKKPNEAKNIYYLRYICLGQSDGNVNCVALGCDWERRSVMLPSHFKFQ